MQWWTLPPLNTPDHSVIAVSLVSKSFPPTSKYCTRCARSVWHYRYADFAAANDFLIDVLQDELIDHEDLLDKDPVEKVSEFEYLGIIISEDLFWSKQVAAVVTRPCKILGVIFRKFYPWCDTSTLLKLYTTCAKPHLQYRSFVWDPPLLKDQQVLEEHTKDVLQTLECVVFRTAWTKQSSSFEYWAPV